MRPDFPSPAPRGAQEMLTPAELAALNTPEPKLVLLARLMTEAIGKPRNVTVADALEFRRDAYGLTQAEFAALLLLGQSHYSEVIHGKRDLPIKATRRAYAIGVPASVLLAPR